jgi:AmiR/NasT family two-component response regulator
VVAILFFVSEYQEQREELARAKGSLEERKEVDCAKKHSSSNARG